MWPAKGDSLEWHFGSHSKPNRCGQPRSGVPPDSGHELDRMDQCWMCSEESGSEATTATTKTTAALRRDVNQLPERRINETNKMELCFTYFARPVSTLEAAPHSEWIFRICIVQKTSRPKSSVRAKSKTSPTSRPSTYQSAHLRCLKDSLGLIAQTRSRSPVFPTWRLTALIDATTPDRKTLIDQFNHQ